MEGRLILPIFTAILPRIWLAPQLQKRFIMLNTHGHPYKGFIQHCISQKTEEPLVRIIKVLNNFIQTISEAETVEIQQLFMGVALYECELLNEAYKEISNS